MRYALALCISIALTGVLFSIARHPAAQNPAGASAGIATHGDTTYPITVSRPKPKQFPQPGRR
jgi:hypothetical protein